MKMWTPALFYIVTALAVQSQGIEFSAVSDDSHLTQGLRSCGLIKCSEEKSNDGDISTKKLTVRKKLNGEVVLFNVDRYTDGLNRYKDGYMVNASIDPAVAQIIVFNTQDCDGAEFICEIIRVDKFGVEHASVSAGCINRNRVSSVSSDLAAHRKISPNNNAALASALQLSAIIQQSQAYLASRIEHVHDSLKDKLFDVDTTLSALEKSLNSVHGNRNSDATYCQPTKENQTDRLLNDLRQQMTSMKASLTQTAEETATNVEAMFSSFAQFEDRLESLLIESNNKTVGMFETLLDAKKQGNEEVSFQRQNPTVCTGEQSSPHKEKYKVIYTDNDVPSYLCDTDGGWTVIQRRTNGYTDFYRDWAAYKNGFGGFDSDFWLGLDQIHNITAKSHQELMVTMMFNGRLAYALYKNFYVAGEHENYRLSVGVYTGTAGDSLREHDNQSFSTFDKDHDVHSTNCAEVYIGAWWYNHKCHSSNLNGKWGEGNYKGPRWEGFTNTAPVTMSEMKIRKIT